MHDVVSFTGHRPTKLGGYSPSAFNVLVSLAEGYLKDNEAALGISGMALGWDMAAAQACINLKIPFLAAVPFKGQERLWPDASKAEYNRLLRQAFDAIFVCEPGFAAWKMQVRNEFMVNEASRVCALWDGTKGGTANCVKYATGRVPLDNLWDVYALRK